MVAPYITGRLVEDTNDPSSLSLTPIVHVIAYLIAPFVTNSDATAVPVSLWSYRIHDLDH